MAGSFGDLDESGERAMSRCRQPVAVSSSGVRRTSKSPRSTPVADSGARLPLPRRRLARGRCLLVTEPRGSECWGRKPTAQRRDGAICPPGAEAGRGKRQASGLVVGGDRPALIGDDLLRGAGGADPLGN
jgi:hypothetical protein